MLKKSLVVLGSIVFLLSGLSGTGMAELELKPFLYEEDFEEKDPVKFWTSQDRKYTVNFKGLTEEKAYSGKKSFKLDVTLIKEGLNIYWLIPISKIPCEGKLRLSAHVLVESGNVGIGSSVIFPPSTHTGCVALSSYSPTNGEWKSIDVDLVEFGRNTAAIVVPKYIQAAKPANVGVYADRVGLFLGRGRTVFYIDDVKIEGEVPDGEAYKEEIKKRWAPIEKKGKEQIASWEKTLSEREKALYSLTGLSSEAEKMKKEAEKNISSLKRRIETIKTCRRNTKGAQPFEKGVLGIGIGEKKGIDSSLKQLKNIILSIHAISAA